MSRLLRRGPRREMHLLLGPPTAALGCFHPGAGPVVEMCLPAFVFVFTLSPADCMTSRALGGFSVLGPGRVP